MPQIQLMIITYRDVFQWVAKQKGSLENEYKERSLSIGLSESNLKDLGIVDGDEVRLSNAVGSVVVQARLDPECRQGFGFMPISYYSNKLVSYDVTKANLPNFKRIEVLAEPVNGEAGEEGTVG